MTGASSLLETMFLFGMLVSNRNKCKRLTKFFLLKKGSIFRKWYLEVTMPLESAYFSRLSGYDMFYLQTGKSHCKKENIRGGTTL